MGFVYATGDAEINKALPYNSASVNGQVKLTGTASDYGFNAGIFFKATEKLSIGIDYRSKIMMKLKNGDAEFTVPQSIQQMGIPEKNKFNATLPLPSNLDFGISYQITKKMLVSLELDYVHWSVYDSLTFTFKENPTKLNSHNPRKYNDSYVTRVGMQYTLNDKLALRCGGYYDPAPTNKDYFNPETTSLNTIGVTLGMTYKPSRHFDIDFYYDGTLDYYVTPKCRKGGGCFRGVEGPEISRQGRFENYCNETDMGYAFGCFGKILNDNWKMDY